MLLFLIVVIGFQRTYVHGHLIGGLKTQAESEAIKTSFINSRG